MSRDFSSVCAGAIRFARSGRCRLHDRYMALGGQQSGPASRIAVSFFQLIMPVLRTSKSRARLRMTEYRGKVSATMIYDQLPINDVFRKLHEDTVLGVMDNKIVNDPFFFTLTRGCLE